MASIDSGLVVSESHGPQPLSQATGLPQLHRTTIARRAKGEIKPRRDYREQCSLLSQAQEQRLLQYIDELTRRGLPPNHYNVRVFASNISGKWPGKNWTHQFVRRHKDVITSQYLTGFDINRKKADNWGNMKQYFGLVQEKLQQYNYTPGNIYNIDEKGFMIGVIQKTKRIFVKKWFSQGKLQGAAQDGNRTWITLVAGICADGTSLPPALIYPALSGNIQDVWLDDYQPEDGAYFSSSATGWTNNELALDWLTRVFDRATKKKASHGREPRLLFLDGHGSHINMSFLEMCYTLNIHVCAYPPHSTHRLQPLDVSLFSPLATYYSQELDNWIQATQGLCKMNKRQFYKLFKPAYKKAFSEKNIWSGWEQTGLHPFNPARVLNQLSTKPQPQESRPTSASSGSRSIFSVSDRRVVTELIRETLGDVLGCEGRRVVRLCHDLQAKVALLQSENEGLREAVRIQKKQKKPRKALFTELRANEENKAIFFSPAKISQARELQAQREKDAEAAQVQRRQTQLERQQRKQEKEELGRIAAAARLAKREKSAHDKAEKQARREETLQQRLANLQLSNEQRIASKNQPKKSRKPRSQALHSGAATEQVERRVETEVPVPTSKVGRQLRRPQHLENYQL
jgi:hypothetical protein